jgi:hypothetical protein
MLLFIVFFIVLFVVLLKAFTALAAVPLLGLIFLFMAASGDKHNASDYRDE